MKRTDKKATFGQQATKVTQLADTLSQAISRKEFLEGDSLPSINQLSAHYGVSRDTVFKAFLDLRERGLIDSTPGKGYYCYSTNIPLSKKLYTTVSSNDCLLIIRSTYCFTNTTSDCSIPSFANP